MKKVLVLGGSYFAGRVFNILASRTDEFVIDVINRGKYPLNLPNVTQYISDRHDISKVEEIVSGKTYDAVLDFCAYEPGDISSVFPFINAKQYVYISTASVYVPTNDCVDENYSVIEPNLSSEMSAYVSKKLLLERELLAACENTDKVYTILRPAFVYGPFNYAPRESFFIQNICAGNPIPYPADANAKFNFVYVLDIAAILMKLISNEKTFNEVYNLSSPEEITYKLYFEELEKCNGKPFATETMTCRDVNNRGINLPFPMTSNELYDGSKICRALDFSYTSFEAGMKKTFSVFYDIFSKR